MERFDCNQKRRCFFPQISRDIKIIIFQQFSQALLILIKLFKTTPNYKPSVRLHFGDSDINVSITYIFIFLSRSDHKFAGGVRTPPSGQMIWCQMNESSKMNAVTFPRLWFGILPTSVWIQISTTKQWKTFTVHFNYGLFLGFSRT